MGIEAEILPECLSLQVVRVHFLYATIGGSIAMGRFLMLKVSFV